MRRRPEEIAAQLIGAHGEEALHEAECLAALHFRHGGAAFYVRVLAEVGRLLDLARSRPFVTAGYHARGA